MGGLERMPIKAKKKARTSAHLILEAGLGALEEAHFLLPALTSIKSFATRIGDIIMTKLIDNLVNEARELKCSERIINNLLVAGDFQSMCELEEEVENTKRYLAREAARKAYVNYNQIAREAARLAVKEA